MSPLVWLVLAIAAGLAAAAVGLPAWRGVRSRGRRNEQAERYRAWRHGSRGAASADEGMTLDERRRLTAGAGLAALAAIALVAFFVTS